MKRNAWFACLCCLLLLLSACAPAQGERPPEEAQNENGSDGVLRENGLAVYEISAAADQSDTGTHTGAYSLWTGAQCAMDQDPSAPRSRAISFDGISYTGSYWYSTTELYDTYASDFYQFDGGWFSVRAGTEELASLALLTPPQGDNLYQWEIQAEAVRLAEQYIDPADYQLTASFDGTIHTFRFRRMVGTLPTCAEVSVGIYADGTLGTFCRKMTGEMDAALERIGFGAAETLAGRLSSQEALQAVEKKLNQTYSQLDAFDMDEKTLVLLETGDLGLACRIAGTLLLGETPADDHGCVTEELLLVSPTLLVTAAAP